MMSARFSLSWNSFPGNSQRKKNIRISCRPTEQREGVTSHIYIYPYMILSKDILVGVPKNHAADKSDATEGITITNI